MKKFLIVTITILIVTSCLCGAAYAVWYFLFAPNTMVVPAFSEGGLHLVIEGEIISGGKQPKLVRDEILLPFETIKQYIDPHIHWDSKLEKLTVTTRDRVIRMKTDSLNAFVNNKPVNLNIPVVRENGAVWAPIEFLSEFYNIRVTYLKENNVVIVDFKNSAPQQADVIEPKAVVRRGPSVREPILRKFGPVGSQAGVAAGSQDAASAGSSTDVKPEVLRIYGESELWYKVRTREGAIGYIEKKFVTVRQGTEQPKPGRPDPSAPWKPIGGKLNMVWDYTYGNRPDLSKRKKIEGLDVISPTWFQVVGLDGSLKNRADAGYVEWAHANGYKVWALFSNSFDQAGMTGSFLRSTDARDNAIRQLLAFAALYKLDGINIDFEEMPESDRDALTQFVREITPLLREQGLTVSIDINTAGCYDRKALGEVVDYVALMAYDQHWKGGGKAGSVAEFTWVERTVQRFLQTIPAEKLILGVPFYTRLWREEPQGEGKVKLTSQALSMETAQKQIEENKAQARWEEESGQFYAEYNKDGATYKVWLEEAHSINLKSSLVHKYHLAGAAAWRLDFEFPEIWNVLRRNLKTFSGYAEWEKQFDGKIFTYGEFVYGKTESGK